MPASEKIAHNLELIAKQPCPCRSIVDVHCDFWTDNGARAQGGIKWWRSEGHIANLERSIAAADVVTVPALGYVDVVARLGKPLDRIVVVPDAPCFGEDDRVARQGWVEALSLVDQFAHVHADRKDPA